MSNSFPLVSVICTVRNQRPYVAECLESVRNQCYGNIELIVIDNGSTDGSLDEVHRALEGFSRVRIISNRENQGLCRAFNTGWRISAGAYLVDLSADDVLLPHRISRQVAFFEAQPPETGVIFSNAYHIDASGRFAGRHYPIAENGRAVVEVPSGEVFRHVLQRYFISTPTIMMRRAVLDRLGGYDERLVFEDFDFTVRSSRYFRYAYQDEVLTAKRVHAASMSAEIVCRQNRLLESTWQVCRKACELCRTLEERKALASRMRTFIRKCFYTQQFALAFRFRALLRQMGGVQTGFIQTGFIQTGFIQTGFIQTITSDPVTEIILGLCRLRVPVNTLYKNYRLLRNYGTSAASYLWRKGDDNRTCSSSGK